MQKIKSLLKMAFAGALLFGLSSTAQAYPTLAELNGTYTLKANVEFTDNSVEPYLLDETEFTISNGKLTSFVTKDVDDFGFNGSISLQYDEENGSLILKNNVLGWKWVGTFSSGKQYNFGYSPDLNGTWPGELTNSVNTDIVWQVTPEGNIVIPDFSVVNYINPSNPGVLAKYTNVIVDGYDPGQSGGGDDDDDVELAGTYTVYLQQVDFNGGTKDAVEVQVEVSEVGSDDNNINFTLKEVGSGNYFLGQSIPFTYNTATKKAEFKANEGGGVFAVDGEYYIIAPFQYGERGFEFASSGIQVPFSSKGFEFAATDGLAIFTNGSATNFDPQELYAAYFILNAPAEGNGKFDDGQGGDDGQKDYPAITTLAGQHTMVATVTYENNLGSVAGITSAFPSTKTFEISENGVALDGFVGNGNTIGLSYDQSTGTITPRSNNLGSYLDMDNGFVTYNFGWANAAGEFTGLMSNGIASWGNPTMPTIQVDEYGNIIIPDFTIVNYTYNQTGGPVIVRYSNIKVDGFDPSESVGKSLYFDDVEMEVEQNSTDAVTAQLNIELKANPAFQYQGFQFDVKVPAEVEVTAYSSTVAPSIEVRPVANAENTYRVLAYGAKGENTVGTIATLTLSTTWNDDTEYPVEDKISIVSPIVFSTVLGEDIANIEGYVGNITITEKTVPADEIVVGDVTVMAPSSSASEDDVDNITTGESLHIDLTLKPEETTESKEDIVWSSDDVEGLEFSYDDEGNLIVNTDGVEVTEPTEVTIKGKLGDLEAEYTFTINPVILGDSNNNGEVTVADVVTTSNYIIEDPVARFDFPNANVITAEVDGEQEINIADVNATIAIAFDKTINDRNDADPYQVRRRAGVYNTADILVADNFSVNPAKENVIAVRLENSKEYNALQATLIIPEGMTVIGVNKGARAAAHDIQYKVVDNRVNVVLYSLDGYSFADSNDAVFNLIVTAAEDCRNLEFRNIKASDNGFNTYILSGEGGRNLTGTTGIDGIDADEEGCRYFDLNGIQIPRPDKGVYIRVNSNGEAVKVVK